MFVGHYGVSFAAKKAAPTVPLWVLFIAVQLLDVAWAPLVLLGVEKLSIVPGVTRASPLFLYYMPFTHSLVAAIIWSAAAYVVWRVIAGRGAGKAALIVAAAVFSHWVLDFVVHRPDLPLYDNSAKVGLGLWNYPVPAFLLEAAVLFGGLWLYLRAGPAHSRALVVFGVAMLAIHAYVFLGPPPVSERAAAWTALTAYAVFAVIIGLIERPPQRLSVRLDEEPLPDGSGRRE